MKGVLWDRRDLTIYPDLSETRVNPQPFGDLAESLIFCPQKRWRREKDQGDQVFVDKTDAEAVQPARLDHRSNLTELRHSHLR